jgi:antitoxin MazE
LYIHGGMKIRIAKWGNSVAVRLPKIVSDELGLSPGGKLDLIVGKGEIRLRKLALASSARLLAEMIAEAKRLGPRFEPEAVDWGPDVGSEIIDDAYSRGEITLNDVLKRAKPSKRSAPPSRKQSHAPRRRRHRMG